MKRDRNNARRVISHRANVGQQKRKNKIRRDIRAVVAARSFLGKSLRMKLKLKTTLTFLFRHQLLSVFSPLLTSLDMTFTRKPFSIDHLGCEVLEESTEDWTVMPTLNVAGKIHHFTNYLSLIKKLPWGRRNNASLLINYLPFQTPVKL